MRRIGRWMLNALTALSLLLCVGTCVLWAIGEASARRISVYRGWDLVVADGRMRLDDERRYRADLERSFPGWEDLARRDWRHSKDQVIDFLVAAQPPGWRQPPAIQRVNVYGYPLMWIAITALLPSVRLRRYLVRARRRLYGFCTVCGYDLTRNVSGVCPECGTTIAEAK